MEMRCLWTIISFLIFNSIICDAETDPKSYCHKRMCSYWTIFKEISECADTSAPLRAKHRLSPEQGRVLMDYLSSAYHDKQTWEERRTVIRKDLKQNMGLGNVPETFTGEVHLGELRLYDGYSVQNFGIEILPGIYSTGSVYWPGTLDVRHPLMLNPHGHYEGGRYHPIVQTRCASFAMMGCVAVAYDMFAYGREPQFDEKYHKTSLSQPYNVLTAIRLLDYFLKDNRIDNSRVGITGSSGGGSQSVFVTAIDDRITMSIPVVMISSSSFGGCPCESGTRIHFSGGFTNNVELSSLCAPRPMLLVSDGEDWTKDFPEIDYPHISRIYGFYGKREMLSCIHLPDECHDYGPSKRRAAYEFVSAHWGLDLPDESRCVIEADELLKVWGEGYENLPENAVRSIDEFARLLGWEKDK